MKKKFITIPVCFFLIAVCFFICCKRETDPPVDVGKNYFPGNTGHWIIYKVDSAVWNGFLYPDTANENFFKTFNYFIKEKNDSVYFDNERRSTIILGRYKKDSANTGWYNCAAWAVNITTSTVEKVEENKRFVKMVFPVSENAGWNGNAYNTLPAQIYSYQNCFTSYTINSHFFDSTVTVRQQIDSTVFESHYELEVYAAHIGMVYKRYRSIERNAGGHITNGVDYSYIYESSGNN